jgi:hypothetical protein
MFIPTLNMFGLRGRVDTPNSVAEVR